MTLNKVKASKGRASKAETPQASFSKVKSLRAKPSKAKSSKTKSSRDLPVKAFTSPQAWEDWLKAQPATSEGVWLKLAKQSAKAASVSRQEAIDGALCHGWIDGQLDKFDEDWWLIRFTPRKPGGKWSEKNRDRALALIKEGRMTPAGLHHIEQAKSDGRWEVAYASQSKVTIPEDLDAALAQDKKAKSFFATLEGANRYSILHRVHTAKKPETRARRIETFVAMLSRGETIHPRKPKAK
ncbi:YdeI/OmpD-associated family protein [Bradyrhizobium sp. SYSU BS000235]|uniref:YdeI/OmpD-associated family protein n=1 Tax=Bradyrhizobium sp. SYSU BS000235 TaxID=3411332 RepID=UPI003C711FDC